MYTEQQKAAHKEERRHVRLAEIADVEEEVYGLLKSIANEQRKHALSFVPDQDAISSAQLSFAQAFESLKTAIGRA